MTFEWLLILVVGFVAGNVNTVVGSGSLLTFPTLIALGYPPLLANVTNTIGLAPGSVSPVRPPDPPDAAARRRS